MGLHKLTAGDGYTYLTRGVAARIRAGETVHLPPPGRRRASPIASSEPAGHPVRVTDAAPVTTVRVVKRKWDGTVSAVDTASRLGVADGQVAWIVHAGSSRSKPRSGSVEVVEGDELWLSVTGAWWVLCGYVDAERSLTTFKVHASAPFEPPDVDEIGWVDLDLDFDITSGDVALRDEAEFHDHARTMAYPKDVVRGAWSGISTMAARYTTGDWPFDGALQDWVDSGCR